MWVAAIGILINGFTAWLFMKGQKEDLNIKGAFMHMAADAAVALGVVIAGFIIKLTHYNWIDPVMCFVIIIVVVWGTRGLLKDSVNPALDAVPEGVSIAKVKNYLKNVKGVTAVYDLHIWGMSTTQIALSVHLLVPDHQNDAILLEIRDQLHEQFEITHPTIQIIRDEKTMAYKKDCISG
ncbi:cation diffusion facilitator family transporter [Mucilaginibacter humi]|uniref:cation diffusion facilitator family transporter n=1 Tax=Mucilaginibacter humi TaxID=2732510 RepID=UPI0021D2EF8D|nr:cation diffusion facilitator family transporter [Mucilaginibacter humi]